MNTPSTDHVSAAPYTANHTSNKYVIIGLADDEAQAQRVYQTAANLGESVVEATVVTLGGNSATRTPGEIRNALRERITSMYLPDDAQTTVVVSSDMTQGGEDRGSTEAVQEALSDINGINGITLLTVTTDDTPTTIIERMRSRMETGSHLER